MYQEEKRIIGAKSDRNKYYSKHEAASDSFAMGVQLAQF